MADSRNTLNADMMPQKSRTTTSNQKTKQSQTTRNGQNPNKKRSGKKKLTKKQKGKRKLIAFIIEIIVLLILIVALYFANIIGKIDFDDFGEDDAGINEDLDTSFLQGYTNIAIFGLDNRDYEGYEAGNSDVIMIASINNDTKEVRLVSVYRDTYLNVDIEDGKYSKANSAFQRGGVKQAVQMLNTNLDLDITDYVCVDWKALIETIDGLGGVEVNVTDEEVYFINAYVDDTANWVSEADRTYISASGLQTLTGTQATAYCRIRSTAGDDFMRAVRQRMVLQAMMDKVKTADIGTLFGIAKNVVDDISTSYNLAEILGLASCAKDYNVAGTQGFPFNLTCDKVDGVEYVLPVELSNNVVQLHQYLFNDEEYEISNTCQKISNNIRDWSGISYDGDYTHFNLDKYLEQADPEWEETHSTEDTETE